MKIKDLLSELKVLKLPPDQYAIYGSGPMAVRGMRETNDLDLVVKDDLYKKLQRKYKEIKPGHIKIGKIEIYACQTSFFDEPEKIIDRTETIEGFKFVRLEDLLKWKKKMGREKDLKDIKLIRKYLRHISKNAKISKCNLKKP